MFENNRKKFNKGIATLFVMVVLFSSFSTMFARKAEAFFFVDWVNLVVNTVTSVGTHANWIKTYLLDGVAFQVTNLVLEKIAASTVNWINTGFKGSPAFVTNPEAYFTDLGDKIAGNYIFNNPNLNFLCGPISAKIRIALQSNYIGDNNRYRCTLTQVGQNMDNFMADFNNGGWDNFFEVTQRQQNNPIGAYMMAENEMNLQIATQQGTAQAELNQGGGFMSYKKCRPGTEMVASNQAGSCNSAYDSCMANNEGDSNNQVQCGSIRDRCYADTANIAVGDCPDSAKETVTPGSVIESKLNDALNLGTGRLLVSTQINQIVSALLNQLASQVVGGIGSGLRGLSQPDTTNNNQTFTSQLSTPAKDAAVNTYFKVSAESMNDISNLPPYDPNFCRNNPNDPSCLPPAGSVDNQNQYQNPVCDPSSPTYNPNDPTCTTTP